MTETTSKELALGAPLRNSTVSPLPRQKRKRSLVACEWCRSRKRRCEGNRPTCQSCAFHGVSCVYEAPKIKVNGTKKKNVDRLQGNITVLESKSSTTKDLGGHIHEGSLPQTRVPNRDRDPGAAPALLALSRAPLFADTPTPQPSSRSSEIESTSLTMTNQIHTNRKDMYEWDERGDEKELDTDAMGTTSRGGYHPGFFGGSSTLSFVEDIKASLSSSVKVAFTPTTATSRHRPTRPSKRITVKDIETLTLPPRRTADHLVYLYFRYVHTLFPWLHEPSFRAQYERSWTTPPDPATEADSLFYCLLNLVLALGCQFSTLFESSIHSGDTFFNRAKTLLGFTIFDVGSLEVVQALLLMANYLQSTNRPNRCWNVLGMGIRVAQGLGLHIDPTKGDLVERETRRRAWWGCVLMDRVLAMLYGRPLMIHDGDADFVALPAARDDQDIMPTSIRSTSEPSKMAFFIATCRLYRIMGDILLELYSPKDDYGTMTEGQWLAKLSSIMKFDRELNDWLGSVPRFLKWGSNDEVSDDIVRQRNVLRARTLNVRNLLYRPSLIFLSRSDYAGENSLDLSTTLNCAHLCVASAKDTIYLLHSTAFCLTGPFWYNLFFIYTAATVLLGARLSLKNGEIPDLEEDWNLALDYLRSISSKSISAQRCLKVLEVMHSQLKPFPNLKPAHLEVKLESPRLQPTKPSSDSACGLTSFGAFPAPQVDWDMQDLAWSNLPWDWNLIDDLIIGGIEGGPTG